MAFQEKTNWVGLSEFSSLQLKSNNHNSSVSVLQIPGIDGSIIGDQITGSIKNPSCDYIIVADSSIRLALGEVINTLTPAPYALQHIHISTGAGVEPTVTADAVQIEQGARRTYCIYPLTLVNLSPARHASTFGAFEYTQSPSLTLQTCEYDASVIIDPTTINNEPKASDATGGVVTVSPTFWTDSDSTHPTITIQNGWHITAEWNCVGADASMFVWTTTLSQYIEAQAPTP